MSETPIEVVVNGDKVTLTPDELAATLGSSIRIQECNVSVKETRQRAAYTPCDKFLSANLDFRPAWAIVDGSSNPTEAKKLLGGALTKKILDTETYLFSILQEFYRKDGFEPYTRR